MTFILGQFFKSKEWGIWVISNRLEECVQIFKIYLQDKAAELNKLKGGSTDDEDECKAGAGISWGMADDAEEFPDMDQVVY